MRIWLLSDLHMPHGNLDIEHILPTGVPDADVCVIAGDLIEGDPASAVDWLDVYIAPIMPTIYVLGNHEFYNAGRGMDTLRNQAQQRAMNCHNPVHVLDNMGVTIDGVRFLGSTMWTDFDVFGAGDETSRAYAMHAAASSMNDYRFPAFDGRSDRWSPALSRRQHLDSRLWLEQELRASDLPTLVVTHHAPHPSSIAVEFERDLVTAAFVSDMGDVMERYRPALWLHGHVHSSFDYTVGETRIVCNPKGYGRENARRFDPAMVLDIPTPPGG